MEMDKFLSILKNAKQSQVLSNTLIELKRISPTEIYLYRAERQKGEHYKEEMHKGVKVLFNNCQEGLTIFQAGFLFYLFAVNKKVYDYAEYHKCKAGQEFITNIKEALVI